LAMEISHLADLAAGEAKGTAYERVCRGRGKRLCFPFRARLLTTPLITNNETRVTSPTKQTP
jgi:hypothetical protein